MWYFTSISANDIKLCSSVKNRKREKEKQTPAEIKWGVSLRIERHQKTIWLQCFSVHPEIESGRQRAAWKTGQLRAGITYKTNNHSRSRLNLRSIQSHQFTASPNVCPWTMGGGRAPVKKPNSTQRTPPAPSIQIQDCCCKATVLTTFHVGYLHMQTLFYIFRRLYSVGVSLGDLIDRRWKPRFSRCRRIRVLMHFFLFFFGVSPAAFKRGFLQENWKYSHFYVRWLSARFVSTQEMLVTFPACWSW